MSRPKAALLRFTEMALPQPARIISRLREPFHHSHDVDEEERHLMSEAEELQSPQSPNYPLLLSLLEDGAPPTLSSDGAPCIRLVRELRSSLQPTHAWLNPADVMITGKYPVAAGGFADVLEGVLLDGRKIIVKSYRRYVVFDHTRVISIRKKSDAT